MVKANSALKLESLRAQRSGRRTVGLIMLPTLIEARSGM
jgi:hypothetical protein